jgi:hypothetical protein
MVHVPSHVCFLSLRIMLLKFINQNSKPLYYSVELCGIHRTVCFSVDNYWAFGLLPVWAYF